MHPFGELLKRYLNRKPVISQAQFARQINIDKTALTRMMYGQRLEGRETRWHILNIIRGLIDEKKIVTINEANDLLAAANQTKLDLNDRQENELLRLLAWQQADMAHRAAGSGRIEVVRTNLPHPSTNFVGREREIAEIKALLPSTHLFTLSGAAGIGKSRLALQVARQLLTEIEDGIWRIDLAAMVTPEELPQTLMRVLQLRQEPGQSSLSAIRRYLHTRQIMLIFDNCGHMIDVLADLVQGLLSACPSLRVLLTSREAAHIPGERVWYVPPLALPDPAHLPESAAGYMHYDAIRLFVDRAKRATPDFRLTRRNMEWVYQVCRDMAGIPLAIELAAGTVKQLEPEQRELASVEEKLAAIIGLSYNRLTAHERILFNRLAVAADGWSIETIEVVCAGIPATSIQASEVLDLLDGLVNKSLVRIMDDAPAQRRYRLLEPLRRFAQQQLEQSGEAAIIWQRFVDYYLQLCGQAEHEFIGAQQRYWMQRIDEEHSNIIAVLHWSLEQAPEICLRMSAAIWHYWVGRGTLDEGTGYLERVLQADLPTLPEVRSRALTGLAMLIFLRGDSRRAKELAEEGLAIAGETQDAVTKLYALRILGVIELNGGDLFQAESLLEESLALSLDVGDTADTAVILHNLALAVQWSGDRQRAVQLWRESIELGKQLGTSWTLAYSQLELGYQSLLQGEYGEAAQLFHESLELSRRMNDTLGISFALRRLGDLAMVQNDYAQAHTLYNESLALRLAYGESRSIAHSLAALGHLAYLEHDYTAARTYLEESLARAAQSGNRLSYGYIATLLGCVLLRQGDVRRAGLLYKENMAIQRAVGSLSGIAEALSWFAGLAAVTGQYLRAARLLGAAEALHTSTGSLRELEESFDYQVTLALLREHLSQEIISSAWTAGQTLPVEQAIAEALGTLEAD